MENARRVGVAVTVVVGRAGKINVMEGSGSSVVVARRVAVGIKVIVGVSVGVPVMRGCGVNVTIGKGEEVRVAGGFRVGESGKGV